MSINQSILFYFRTPLRYKHTFIISIGKAWKRAHAAKRVIVEACPSKMYKKACIKNKKACLVKKSDCDIKKLIMMQKPGPRTAGLKPSKIGDVGSVNMCLGI